MSAMAAERLREPEQLYVPLGYTPEDADRIRENLTEEQGREFWRQLMNAIKRARNEGDLRAINLVVESWYRTLLFASRPHFDDLWDGAQRTDGPRLSPEDVRRRRSQRDR
ncbi:MAG: hypothetical protein H0W27_06110 [Actinobacteria bacterium]|nr:hypothetical protein [Actinomycetota bacterium]